MGWLITVSFFFKHSVHQAHVCSFNSFLSLQKNISTVCVRLSGVVVKVLVLCSLQSVIGPLTPSRRLE